jgi:hypothetical protein
VPARAGEGAGEVVGRGVKAVETRAARRFVLRGTKVVMRAGIFVFRIVELANPILDLLLLVELIDFVVAWLQREKREEQAEWRRIATFLSTPGEIVRLSPNGESYFNGYGTAIHSITQAILAGQFGHGNFIEWLDKFRPGSASSGFVYATVTIDLERQALRAPAEGEPYPVAYYKVRRRSPRPIGQNRTGNRRALVPWPVDKNMRQGRRRLNYTDQGADVDVSSVKVRYTYPTPS